jgi:hypothetical protein
MGKRCGRWRFRRCLPFRFSGGKFRPAIRDESRGLVVLRVCVAGAGLASCPAMGGAMADTEVKDSGCGCVNVGDKRVAAKVGEVLGPKMRRAVQRATPQMLQDLALEALGKELRSIVEAIVFNIKEQKHLPSAKLLMDLAGYLKVHGEVEEAEMQSFAALLILSLEAETTGEPADAESGK